MNIQIFGKSKCFDTKKAERWFKERRIKFQAVDLGKYGMSAGELKSVVSQYGFGVNFNYYLCEKSDFYTDTIIREKVSES